MGEHNEADEWDSVQAHYAEIRRNAPKRKRRLRSIIQEIKNVPCADCGVKYPPYVMEFDHVRGEKVRDISNMVSESVQIEKLLEEIEKCEVVCANCHRERTFQQRLDSGEYNLYNV